MSDPDRPKFPGGARLRQAREASGLSVTRLAHLSDVPERSIRQYESGRTDPSATNLARLARTLGARMEWIVAGDGPMQSDARASWRGASIVVVARGESGADRAAAQALRDQPGDFYVLPLLKGVAACGPGHVVSEGEVEGPAVIHRDWCPHPERTDYVRCKGHSMEPTIPDGAIVTIDRAENRPEELVGCVVAVWVAEQDAVTLKRLDRNRRGAYVAMPDNQTADALPFELAPDDRIIGRVLTIHAEVVRR